MKHFFALTTALLFSACATTPTVERPAVFKGAAGFNVESGSTRITSNKINENEVFITRNVTFKRTGTLLEDVRYGNVLVPPLKAGTKMYAANYGYGGIGWCIPGVESDKFMDSFMGNTIADCILWKNSPPSAYKINGQAGQSPFFSPKLKGQPNYGKVPKIKEEPVDFGRNFKINVRFRKIRKNKIYIDTVFNDEKNTTTIQTDKYSLADDGTAILKMWGGIMKLTAQGEDTILVNTVQKPTDQNIDTMQLQKLLMQALQAKKSESN